MVFWEKEAFGMTYKELTTNSVLALAILAIGVVIGRIVYYILDKAIDRTRIEKTNAYNFFRMVAVIIKWSVYILFLSLAIRILGIAQVTSWTIDILVVIPALVAALLLILGGFVIAVYLKKSIEESKVESGEILGNIFFYFITYVFMVFALKTALISLDSGTVNILVIILTGIIGAGIAYRTAASKVKKK